MIAVKLSGKAPVKLKNPTFETFPVCSGCVSRLLSHPGWGPATVELQTKAIGELSRVLDKKLGSKSSLLKKQQKDKIEFSKIITFLLQNMVLTWSSQTGRAQSENSSWVELNVCKFILRLYICYSLAYKFIPTTGYRFKYSTLKNRYTRDGTDIHKIVRA